MECSWSLTRYSRLYSDYQKQSHDKSGKTSLFPYFSQSKLKSGIPCSQLINVGMWSTIIATKKHELKLVLKIDTETSCTLQVTLHSEFEDWELEAATQLHGQSGRESKSNSIVLLEHLEFPKFFDMDFKASPKTECISFRYLEKKEKFCFQVDLHSSFECYMCFTMMWRSGILHPQWKDVYKMESFATLKFPENITAVQEETESKSEMNMIDSQITHIEIPDCKLLGNSIPEQVVEHVEGIYMNNEDVFQIFLPSQPIYSGKISFQSTRPHRSVDTSDSHDSSFHVPNIDIEDENLFTPLSFQEFGYK